MGCIEKARLLSNKVLKSGSQARELVQQLVAMDADEKTRKQLLQCVSNCDGNHKRISELIEKGCSEEIAYQDVRVSVEQGFDWFKKKGGVARAMINASKRVGQVGDEEDM